jgi:hypothetical protein
MDMNNFYNNLTDFTNTSIDNLGKTYYVLSDNISNTAGQIIPVISGGTKDPAGILTKVEEEKKIILTKPEVEVLQEIVNNFEKKFESLYVGCYADDPTNPSMPNYLGEVANIEQCVLLGKDKNYKYVGIQQGNKCYASNNLPTTMQADRSTYCNVPCDDMDKGNCGGYFYNQVYKTLDNEITSENLVKVISGEMKITPEKALEIMENFDNSSIDIEKINIGVQNYNNINCHTPINGYFLFILICILIIIIYLLFEYLYRKNENII